MLAGPSVPQTYLVLDIETALDPLLPLVEPGDGEGLPPPPHHQVHCIGVLWLGPDHVARKLGVLAEGKSEPEMLTDFTRFLDKHRPVLITYNGRGFDLPVLAARCLAHGVPFPYYYQERDVRYRFSAAGHLDLMDFLSDFGAAKRARLDVMARLCGMPGKVGVAGKDVGPLIHAGRLSEVCDYCLCDVVQTTAIFLRVQLLRGELDRTAYLTAMRSLLTTAQGEARVGVVAAAWDDARLLLGEPLVT
jgi:predicted PolB exonuclease-like 3'-5' exonuclease